MPTLLPLAKLGESGIDAGDRLAVIGAIALLAHLAIGVFLAAQAVFRAKLQPVPPRGLLLSAAVLVLAWELRLVWAGVVLFWRQLRSA